MHICAVKDVSGTAGIDNLIGRHRECVEHMEL
jgi:hypothetical protein